MEEHFFLCKSNITLGLFGRIPRETKWILLVLSSIYYSELSHILPCFSFHLDFLVQLFLLLWWDFHLLPDVLHESNLISWLLWESLFCWVKFLSYLWDLGFWSSPEMFSLLVLLPLVWTVDTCSVTPLGSSYSFSFDMVILLIRLVLFFIFSYTLIRFAGLFFFSHWFLEYSTLNLIHYVWIRLNLTLSDISSKFQ